MAMHNLQQRLLCYYFSDWHFSAVAHQLVDPLADLHVELANCLAHWWKFIHAVDTFSLMLIASLWENNRFDAFNMILLC